MIIRCFRLARGWIVFRKRVISLNIDIDYYLYQKTLLPGKGRIFLPFLSSIMPSNLFLSFIAASLKILFVIIS